MCRSRWLKHPELYRAHVRQEKNGAFGRQQEHGLPIRERWLPGGLNQLVRAGDVKSRQVLCFGLFSSVFNAEGNVPPPVPHQGLYDFGEAVVTSSQHEEDVSAFTEKLWNKRDAGKRTVLPPPFLLLVPVHKSRMK